MPLIQEHNAMAIPCVVSIDLGRYVGLLDREGRRSAAIAAVREAIGTCTLADLRKRGEQRGSCLEVLEVNAVERVADPNDDDAVAAEMSRLEQLTLSEAIDPGSGCTDSLVAPLLARLSGARSEACNRPGSHAVRGDSTMIDSVLPAARLDSRRCVLLTLAVAAELVLHGCRIRQARAYPGPPAIEIEPPRRGLFETYARTVPSVAGIAVPIRYATILHGVRVTWTSAGEPRSGSRSAGGTRRERVR